MAQDDTLSDNFNTHDHGNGVEKTLKHGAQHVLVMGAMMGVIALAAPAVMASPLAFAATEPATIGNLVVQSAYGSWEMIKMIGDTLSGLVSIGGELISNTANFNLAPTTWESMVMSHDAASHAAHTATEHVSHEATAHAASHGAEHTATAAGAGHAAHVTEAAQIEQFNKWTMELPPEELAEIKEEANLIYDQSLFDYFQDNFLSHE